MIQKGQTFGDKRGLDHISKFETPINRKITFVKYKVCSSSKESSSKHVPKCIAYKKSAYTAYKCLNRIFKKNTKLM